MKNRKIIWQEDECTGGLPGHKSIEDVIKQHTGMDLPTFKAASQHKDCGDGFEWFNDELKIVVGFYYDGWFIEKVLAP